VLGINGERAAMYAPSFIKKMEKTRELQIQGLTNKFKEFKAKK
jgi:hypothetical protein